MVHSLHLTIFTQFYLLQYRRQCTTFAQSSPAGDSRIFADQKIVSGWQANRWNMRRERQWAFQSNQRQIVFVSEEVVLRVHHLLRNSTLDVRQSFLHRRKIVLAHSNPDLRRQQAITESITNICFVLHFSGYWKKQVSCSTLYSG